MATPNTNESMDQEFNELISKLPKSEGWFSDIYEYQGVWYAPEHLEALISAQKTYQVQDTDVFLASYPKSGTTWLKSIIFTLLNREKHPVGDENHPLLGHNPHDIVHFLERPLYKDGKVLDFEAVPSPRFFSTHVPYPYLPENVRAREAVKFVYVSRNPKDTFVSFWHFCNKLRAKKELGASPMDEMFEKFGNGVSPYGPIWDHALGYWEESKRNPNRVFFLKYEEMSEKPAGLLKRLAEFLNCPFSAEEEESGAVEKVLKLCSFETLSNLEVNKGGKREFGEQDTNVFFRKGTVGDYKNHLSEEMVEKLDQTVGDKLSGSGLVF